MENESPKTRFAILDIMRMVAALAVFFYHFSIYSGNPASAFQNFSKFGYLGVNFFFLLSGFVIMSSAENTKPTKFAVARAIRLYPAFLMCLLFTVSVLVFLGGIKYSVAEIAANATILNDYLDIRNIDGVYWTLQAELKFYLCVFILLLTGLFKYWRVWLSVWLLLAVLYFFWSQPFFLGWFISPAYSFNFIGGISAYLLYRNCNSRLVQLFFILSLVFGAAAAARQANGFIPNLGAEDQAIASLMSVTFYIFFFLVARGWFEIPKTEAIMVIGALSYPFYLIHNEAGKQIYKSIMSHLPYWGGIALVLTILICVSLMVVYLEKIIRSRV